MDISRFLSEMPRRDIGLKPRSEWGKKGTSPKVRKAAEKEVEAKPVAEKTAEEVDRNPPKAVEAVGVYAPAEVVTPEVAAKVEAAVKEAKAATAAARAAVRFEEPPNDLFDAMEYAGVVEPKAEGETRAVLPELPRPAEDGRKKHKRRRRRR